jgi:hypothetical protein
MTGRLIKSLYTLRMSINQVASVARLRPFDTSTQEAGSKQSYWPVALSSLALVVMKSITSSTKLIVISLGVRSSSAPNRQYLLGTLIGLRPVTRIEKICAN